MSFNVEVTSNKIIEANLFLNNPDPACGAEVLFLGRVRDLNFGKKVVAVSYDAFKPLTEKVFLEICNEATIHWGPQLNIKILHRTGKLTAGEISVAILVATPHRDESYEASRYIIEQLKTRSPIWKKEYYENSETEWLQGHALCQHNHAHTHNIGRSAGGGKIPSHGHKQGQPSVEEHKPTESSV